MSKLKLWRSFSLFMVLLLMLSLVAVVLARPVQANVSSITVTPYDTRIIGLQTGYRITMTSGASLNAGDNITIQFPTDTTVPDLSGTPGNVFVKVTPCTTVAVSGRQVTLTIPTMAPIVPGQQFTVTFNQACVILNPTTSGSKTVTVWTTVEPVRVTSSSYEITAVKVYTGGTTFLSEHATITAAIAAAAAGDTITVPAGTFTEDLYIGAGKSGITLNSVSGRDSTTIQLVDNIGIEIDTGADNFKLGGMTGHGFTIASSAGAGTTRNIQLTHSTSGVQISYNTIDTTGGYPLGSMGINIGAAGATDLTISHNNFIAEVNDGSIWGEELGVNTAISNNTFTGPGGLVSGYAVEFKGGTGTSTISGNTISGYSFGIGVLSGSSGTSGLTISNNNVTGCVTGIAFAQYETGNITAVTVTGNTLSSNTNGLRIWSGANVDASQLTIRYNNFVGNTTYGLRNDNAATATAKHNYWGHVSGPSHDSPVTYGDKVSTGVVFRPWLVNTYTGTPPAGEIAISTASPLPDGSTGVVYSTPLTATGGTGPYTWASYSGTLPTGLSIAGSNLSGAPTEVNTFDFALQVKDGVQATYKDFAMQVYGGNLVVTTTSPLPGGTVNVPYGPVQLQAVGGTGSYTWSFDVGSGPLPAGLGLASDGKITGTPTAAGTFPFRVKVTYGILTPGTKDLSITISALPSADQKLIGADATDISSGNNFASYVSLSRFTANSPGTVTKIKVKCSGSGYVKVALYSDNATQPGQPGALLGSVNTPQSVNTGWNDITLLSPVSVTASTSYWLGVACDSSGVLYFHLGGGNQRYMPITFSSYTFPDPAGTGYSSNTNYILVAGWSIVTITAPTVSNSAASVITRTSARLNGAIDDTGLENPTVVIYWGGTDGGTTYTSWAHSVNLGTKSAIAFFTDISGLTAGTPYYYRCFASNSAGGAWATNSVPFSTSGLSAPIVTNSTGASTITATSARLNGAITDTGGVDPTVTIYWGANDGKNSSSNWDNSANLGILGAGTFYTDITDLTRGTKYYYRCFASNSHGPAWVASSENFTTLSGADLKLIGADTATVSTGNNFASYVSLSSFTADSSGSVSKIQVKCSGSGYVKVALYSDSGGAPGAKLGSVDTPQAVGTGWNTITLSTPITVNSGITYWLGVACDASGVLYWHSGGGNQRYLPSTFSSYTFPNPAGSGYSSNANYILVAGVGTSMLPAPPVPPVIVTPKTTITFEWTASSATKYRLQVNTASDFTGTPTFDAEVSAASQAVTLTIGTPYYWRVKAGNTGGWSGWSATGSITP